MNLCSRLNKIQSTSRYVSMSLDAMPIVYNEDRRWNDGIGGFVFMGIAVGIILGLIYAIYDNNGRYMKLFLV